jgi:hypothetical protein
MAVLMCDVVDALHGNVMLIAINIHRRHMPGPSAKSLPVAPGQRCG